MAEQNPLACPETALLDKPAPTPSCQMAPAVYPEYAEYPGHTNRLWLFVSTSTSVHNIHPSNKEPYCRCNEANPKHGLDNQLLA
jgi:hypothetical protein